MPRVGASVGAMGAAHHNRIPPPMVIPSIDDASTRSDERMILPDGVGFSDTTARDLRSDLVFFFKDPISKWYGRRRFPWKFLVQLIKIILATVQLCLFGTMRVSHVYFRQDTRTVFQHLLLEGWTSTRDIRAYPPSDGAYAVYTKQEFFSHLSFALNRYNTINVSAIGSFDFVYNKSSSSSQTMAEPATLCVLEYLQGTVFPANSTYTFDTRSEEHCLPIPLVDRFLQPGDVQDFLAEHNASIKFDQLISARLIMHLKTINLRNYEPYYRPICYNLGIHINFDNTEFSGQVIVSMTLHMKHIENACTGVIKNPNSHGGSKILIDLIDAIVFLICLTSFILCIRALYRADRLKQRTIRYFQVARKVELGCADRLEFVNLWWVAIIFTDLFIMTGTIIKLSVEFRYFNDNLFTAATILLGLGNLLVWCGVLRYLGFFSHYNVMILTLKNALPNILRFTLCVSMVYLGFTFCGWVVLGPYHYKFKSLMTTSECLFSLINGDDMFATFDTTATAEPAIWWFSRIYIYTFVALFIYVVLSLFIAIIMDAYEVIKEVYEHGYDLSDLKKFMSEEPIVEDEGRVVAQRMRNQNSISDSTEPETFKTFCFEANSFIRDLCKCCKRKRGKRRSYGTIE